MSQENKNIKLSGQDKGDGSRKGPKFNIYWIYAIILVVLLGTQFMKLSPDLIKITEQEFTQNMLAKGDVEKLDLVKVKEKVRVYIKPEELSKDIYVNKYKITLPKDKAKGVPLFEFQVTDFKSFKDDIKQVYETYKIPEVPESVVEEAEWFGPVMNAVLSILLIVGIWVLLMRKMGGQGGAGGPGGIFSIGKSKATLFDKGAKVNITFADVAGLDEAKVEVMEIVDFLKNPKKYTALGGKIPKGALLIGPPGTGKTLLAKAMAGEAQVPFFSFGGDIFDNKVWAVLRST